METISLSKEPRWILYVGFSFVFIGVLSFTPFKFEGWSGFSKILFLFLFVGLIIVFRGFRNIGWRISLEGNVLYYQKFNLYSSWKKRRSQEFSLATDKITSIKLDSGLLRVNYEPGRELRFNVSGIDSLSEKKIQTIIKTISQESDY